MRFDGDQERAIAREIREAEHHVQEALWGFNIAEDIQAIRDAALDEFGPYVNSWPKENIVYLLKLLIIVCTVQNYTLLFLY